MSPEQAMGERELTARSDVYALGCVAYEMLVGEPPYTGATAQQILGRVLTAEPVSLSAQRRTVPPHVDAAVLTALEKLPADRFGTVAEFLSALGGATVATLAGRLATRTPSSVDGRAPGPWRRAALMTAVAAVAATAAAAWGWLRDPSARDSRVTRYALAFPKGEEPVGPGFFPFVSASRDGSRVAYFALTAQGPLFRLHDATKLETQSLGAAGAGPWAGLSPNGEWVAYSSGSPGDLRKMAVSGGTTLILVRDSVSGTWAQWAPDGWIYFTLISGALARVQENGGDVEVLAKPDTASGVRSVGIPDVLPGSNAAIVTLFQPAKGRSEIAAVDFSTGAVHRLAGGQVGRYVPTGHLLFSDSDANLLAAPFDPRTLQLTGVPRRVGVQVAPNGIFAITETGTLVYQRFGGAEGRPTWVDRDGAARVVDSAWSARINTLALSPDASQLAVSVSGNGAENIWVKQLDKGPFTRLTNFGGQTYRPAWTRDGKSLTFVSDVDGIQKIFRMRADGTGGRRVVARAFTTADEGFLSADEQWAILRVGSSGRRDIVAYHVGDSTPVMIAATDAEEHSPALSPDGRWIAYVSDESGRKEVYVRPFPRADSARIQVSVAGGHEPVWAPNGRELFYRDGTQDLIAVEVTSPPGFRLGQQRRLFSTQKYYIEGLHAAYGVTRDAKRFLFVANSNDGSSNLVVVRNWVAELESLMASNGRSK
jgi:serine/threonine-protein kinase